MLMYANDASLFVSAFVLDGSKTQPLKRIRYIGSLGVSCL